MKTQLSILVKNESLFSRFFSLLWFINIFKKMPVEYSMDEGTFPGTTLTASNKPYLIDVTPGAHRIYFKDPRAASKKGFRKFCGAIVGAVFGFAAGNASTMFLGGAAGADSAGSTMSDVNISYLDFTVQDGDILKISVQPKGSGKVKVKVLN